MPGNLVLVYDANRISIEDDTAVAFTEDVGTRYEAYGWHVQHVGDGEDLAAVDRALAAARAETGRPSLIVLRTIIGWPAPNKQNTGAAHGSALGEEEVRATKEILGFDPDKTFEVAPEVLEHDRRVAVRGRQAHARWPQRFDAWRAGNPEGGALLDRLSARTLPPGWADALPAWDADPKGVATRKASGEVLAALYPVLPELWGGSADLAESNNTAVKGADSCNSRSRTHGRTAMTPNEKLAELSQAGVAVWLDDLSRDRIRSGDLQSLVDGYSVVGVTTNPTIFAAAISASDSYDDQVHAMAVRKVSVEEALRTITAADVRDACDLLAPVAQRTGRDGRVSLEVAPGLAHDTDATAAEAAHLWWLVDRPNLFIKIPATQQGLAAITTSIARGITCPDWSSACGTADR